MAQYVHTGNIGTCEFFPSFFHWFVGKRNKFHVRKKKIILFFFTIFPEHFVEVKYYVILILFFISHILGKKWLGIIFLEYHTSYLKHFLFFKKNYKIVPSTNPCNLTIHLS